MLLLVKFDEDCTDSCYVGVDGQIQPVEEQYSKGRLFAYRTRETRHWTLLSDFDVNSDLHELSIHARTLLLILIESISL